MIEEEYKKNSEKYFKEMDETCHFLSNMQARIFERSVEDGIPSYFFIKSFLLSYEARQLDKLNLESAGITEVEIYYVVKEKIKTNRGEILPYPIMHFLGYFYRSAAYLSKLTSSYLLKNIPPRFLINNYQTLHSLAIEEAIKEAFIVNKIEIKSNEERFIEVYQKLI